MRHPRTLRVTAYHEAGHAVACWALGIPVVFATIVPEGDYAGRVRLGTRAEPKPFMTHHEERAVCDMAGPAAQRLHAPRSAIRFGAKYDLESLDLQADLIFCKRDGDFPSADRKRPFFRLVERQARQLMVDHWLAVHRVAEELLADRSISGIAVARICREATDEWEQLARYHPGLSAVDYVRRQAQMAKVLPPLRRATIAGATLDAVVAGAPDIAAAVETALLAKGYAPDTIRGAWLAAQRKGTR